MPPPRRPSRLSQALGRRAAPPGRSDRARVLRPRILDHPLARPRRDGTDRPKFSIVDPARRQRLPAPKPGVRPERSAQAAPHSNSTDPDHDGGQGHHDEHNDHHGHDGHDGHHDDYHHYADFKHHVIFTTFFRSTYDFLYCFKSWYPSAYDYCYGYLSQCWPHLYLGGFFGYGASSTVRYEPYPVTVYAAPPPCPYTLGEAWGLLSAGDLEAAAVAFECLREALPGDGLPAAGHALTLAFLGERDEAVPILREALASDPEALEFVPVDEPLARALAELAGLFEYQARRTYGDLDALFMAGALRYLIGDFAAARYALDAATTLGDTHDSTLSLQALVVQALDG